MKKKREKKNGPALNQKAVKKTNGREKKKGNDSDIPTIFQ